jgi:putative exosortase-associated protein (TIGR04073 family)
MLKKPRSERTMKWTKWICMAAFMVILTSGIAHAGADEHYRQQSTASKMLHKLGRGVVNIFTSPVEIPRNIAIEWERTDPVTGLFMGTVKGFGWGFARFATGVYDTFTFPFPVPEDYVPLMDPEFVVTDIWGDHIPELTDYRGNDPLYPSTAPIYPNRFNY